MSEFSLSAFLNRVDRRVIYLTVLFSVAVPLVMKWSLPPASMKTATALFDTVDKLQARPGQFVLLALDFAPSTAAENRPQTLSVLEHLMRRRIPVALITTSPYAGPFLETYPRLVAERLSKEDPSQKYEYGKDWVNLGFKPNASLAIQNIAKADDIRQVLKSDANGVSLMDVPALKDARTIRDVILLGQFTGLVGTFNTWIQMFQADGYKPPMVHGCTSITIPEAFIYYNSKQIIGLLEGVAGAAWYDKLLQERYPERVVGEAQLVNTSLAVAQIVVLLLVFLGNTGYLVTWIRGVGGKSK